MELKLLWTIQLAPLAAMLLIQLLPPATRRKTAPAIGVFASLAAALCALWLLASNLHAHDLPREYATRWLTVAEHQLWRWSPVADYALTAGFLVDPLNLLMITLVTVIAFFVQVFSVYYMADDPSRHRYFGFLSFFSFSMTGLVLSSNLLQTFVFWELVGLTSYLLIGFWYEKVSAATAARKAFVINRLGDLGFYLGVVLLFLLLGTLDFTRLDPQALGGAMSPSLVTFCGLLVFMGVMGKSAQFPFHTWLPDAMEGPTPVSALIHSATMVAAGVFLLARAWGLFGASAATLAAVLAIGGITALVGASLATVQRDIKKIMAYSTVSQLGLMVMGIGAGSVAAGMFHLTTHAFFKSLLFLTAGAFIHRFHSNDIWDIGRQGGKSDRVAVAALAFGLLSLSGVFPFAGFFSKDQMLEALREGHPAGYATAIFVSFLTVFYSTRLFLVVTRAKPHGAPHAAHNGAHAGHSADGHHGGGLAELCRVAPLGALAFLSLVAAWLGSPWGGQALQHFLGGHAGHANWEIIGTTAALIAAGAALGWAGFRDPDAAERRLRAPAGPVRRVLDNLFYMEHAYTFVVKRLGLGLAAILDWFDRTVVNGVLVNGTSYNILGIGRAMSRLQNGRLQDYLSWGIGLGVILVFLLFQG